MTNKQWIQAMTSRFNVSDQDVELIIVNHGIDPDAEVDIKAAKTALCNEFATIIPMANVSEGGYSVTWNMDGIKLFYKQMCDELGIAPVSIAKVRNRSNVW